MGDNNQTNLIINYLPQTLTDEEFTSMFEAIGEIVSAKVVRNKTTGYSYGFGFVNYAHPDSAEEAIRSLNGLQLQNKKIKVALSREREDVKGANLYVRNLPRSMTDTQLSDVFSSYGKIVQCRVLKKTTGSTGVGFVLFDSKQEARSAINGMHGTVPPGGTEALDVKFADDNKDKARAPGSPSVIMGVGRGRGRGGGYVGRGGGYMSSNGGYGQRAPGPMRGRGGINSHRYNPMQAGYGARPSRGMGGIGRGFYGGNEGVMGGYGADEDVMGGGYGIGGYDDEGGMGGYGGGDEGVMGGGYGGGGGYGIGGGGSAGGHILFVYNIGSECDERGLWNLFAPYGTIEKVDVIKDFDKNIGKGYGFVTMSDYDEAAGAIEALNGYHYANKPLQVSFKGPK